MPPTDYFSTTPVPEEDSERYLRPPTLVGTGVRHSPRSRHELLGSSIDYTSVEASTTVVEYVRDRASRPKVNMVVPLATDLLEEQGAAPLHTFGSSMLKDPDELAWEQEAGVAVNQYMDRTLSTSEEKYREFVTDLYKTGMLSFSEKTPRCLITPVVV